MQVENPGGSFYNPDNERKYQIRIIPSTTERWQCFFNVINVGAGLNVTEVEANTGENAKGVIVGNNVTIFNGSDVEAPAPTVQPNPSTDRSQHDYERFDKIKILRYFNIGFEIDVAVNKDVYIADLNPNKSWTLNGQPLSVESSGLAKFKSTVAHLNIQTV